MAILLMITAYPAMSQISPGELSNAHSDLEGIMNCTECHVLGKNVSNNLCLACHEGLKSRIEHQEGYHASGEVMGKECASCHSEHHGRNFDMVRFDQAAFRHQLTGFELTGQHTRIDCRKCHQPDFIVDADLKKNKNTFLGLDRDCVGCHEDVHRQTLKTDCASCHDTEAFAPAARFDHNEAQFLLKGRHREVACIRCHPKEQQNGKEFQRFTGIDFQHCTSCHEDVHDNKFGRNCAECHSEESFHVASSLNQFDHRMTGFDLLGKHQRVDCRKCHVSNFTNPLPHSRCTSCHTDYHKKEFAVNGRNPDCAECHTVNGFNQSLFTLEQHNAGAFPLEGGHLATPCFACHKKSTRWSFRNIGGRCVDCHEDIHAGYIDSRYYPGQRCENCHVVESWKENHFDHNQTSFVLAGAHERQDCMACHGPDDQNPAHRYENFKEVSMACVSCHKNVHHRQFEDRGVTDCKKCHGYDNWKAIYFDHNQAAFKLDGKHVKVDCAACHQKVEEEGEIFVLYKNKKLECIDCHQ